MEELLRRLEKPVQDAFIVAVNNAKNRAQITALENAIISGNIEAILIAAGVRVGMWSALTESIRNVYGFSGDFRMHLDVPRRFGAEFNINNPRAESWLRTNSSTLITGDLMPQQESAIQKILQNGMIKGDNPRTTALDIVGRQIPGGRRSGGIIGLSDPQVQYALNMEDDLETLNWQRYKSRKLRDRRFDSMVKRSMEEGKILPKATRKKIVGRYEDRMLKHRGDTIGRTETLQSLNAASDEALQQIVDEGLAPPNAITRIWRHSYSANERPGHVAMDGQPRGIDDYFLNPYTQISLKAPGIGPGSEVINCRCYVEHEIDFAAVERAA